MASLEIEIFDANGDSETMRLPARWVICPVCEGCATDRGASVECDGGGFTASEWAEQDDDFKEGYLRGDYDRPCTTCEGRGRLQEIAREQVEPEILARIDANEAEDREYRRLCRMERMMGC